MHRRKHSLNSSDPPLIPAVSQPNTPLVNLAPAPANAPANIDPAIEPEDQDLDVLNDTRLLLDLAVLH